MHNATALTTQPRSDITFPQLDIVPGNGLSVLPYPSQRTAMGFTQLPDWPFTNRLYSLPSLEPPLF